MNTKTIKMTGMSLVNLIVRCWSGAAVIKRDTDLGAVATKLPPKGLVVDGQKKLVDPQFLAPLDALRKRAESIIRAAGFPFMEGCYAVPDSRIPDLNREIGKIAAEFEDYVKNVLGAELVARYEEWERKFPEWAAMLSAARLTPQEVQSRCRIMWVFFKPTLADDDPGALANQGLQQAVAAAHEALYDDVRRQAACVLKDTFTNRSSEVGQRALRPVKALAAKLSNFSFLDAGVAKICAVLEAALDAVPREGFIDAVGVAGIVNALQRLSDPQQLASILTAPIVSKETPQAALPIDTTTLECGADTSSDDVATTSPEIAALINSPVISTDELEREAEQETKNDAEFDWASASYI